MTERDDEGGNPSLTERLLTSGDEGTDEGGAPVGRADADADAARSGADVGPVTDERDTEGEPVGQEDVAEDARRSGADTDRA